MTTTATRTTSELELFYFYAQVLKDPMLQEQLKATADSAYLSKLAAKPVTGKSYSFFTQEEVLAAIAIEAKRSFRVHFSLERQF